MKIKKTDPWSYVQLARYIRTEKPQQKLILLTLAFYANPKTGYCFPSYEMLMRDTSYHSKTIVSDSIKYLRDTLGILSWVQGHSNQFKNVANGYTLDWQKMANLVMKQKVAESTPRVAESTPAVAESTPPPC